MFNPFEFQYQVTCNREKGENFILGLQNGIRQDEVSFPKNLLPENLEVGQRFTLRFLPDADATKSEVDSLQKLLQQLIG